MTMNRSFATLLVALLLALALPSGLAAAVAGHTTIGTTTYPQDAMVRLDRGNLWYEERYLRSAVINPEAGYVYFGTHDNPAKIVKVRLGYGVVEAQRVNHLSLEWPIENIHSGVIDTTTNHAYFGTYTTPGRVLKVNLGDGDSTPTLVGVLELEAGENNLTSAVIDTASGHAWFGTTTSPGIVVKVALGAPGEAPTRVGAGSLLGFENNLTSAVRDETSGLLYFGTNTTPGRVVKVDPGAVGEAPERIDAITLESGENSLRCAISNSDEGYAWFGTGTTPGRVVKIRMANDTGFQRLGAVTLSPGENNLQAAIITPSTGHGYFGTFTMIASKIIKVDLGMADDAPTRVTNIDLWSDEEYITSAVYDPISHMGYFGTNTAAGYALRVSLGQRGHLKGNRIEITSPSVIQDVRFYSHAAVGNVRMAIYSKHNPFDQPEHLLWESPAVPNTAENDFLTIPIADGTTPTLCLQPGTYFLGWQVDTDVPVASRTPHGPIVSYSVPHPFGPAPASFWQFAVNPDNSIWTQYLTYEVDLEPPTSQPTAEPYQAGTTITGSYTANDNLSGVGVVILYVQEPSGGWNYVGELTSPTWNYTPTQSGSAANGTYRFATVAADKLWNYQEFPTFSPHPGDIEVVFNGAENGPFGCDFFGDGTAVFPMSPNSRVEITLSGVTGMVTVTINRTVGGGVPPGLNPARLIGERLSINGNLGGAQAMITWHFDPANAQGPGFTGLLNTIFKFNGGTQTGQFSVTPSGNSITFGPVSSFSDWYAGDNDATVTEWQSLQD